jgi:hypothetical protein
MKTETKIKPATSLPWHEYEVAGINRWRIANSEYTVASATSTGVRERDEANASYIAHAANAYPKLVEALRLIRDLTYTDAEGPELRNQNARNHCRASDLLRELGEIE